MFGLFGFVRLLDLVVFVVGAFIVGILVVGGYDWCARLMFVVEFGFLGL